MSQAASSPAARPFPERARDVGQESNRPSIESSALGRADKGDARVDDVLEALHRSLKDQETVQRLLASVRKFSPTPKQQARPVLSGATATKRPQRRKPQRKRAPMKESRTIASTRSLVGAAESLGLDMTSIRPLITGSEKKLARRKQKAAAVEAAKALAHAKHAAATQLQALIPDLEARAGTLRANGAASIDAERGVATAKTALNKRNYRTAIAAVAGSRKTLSEAETAFIRTILMESRRKFVSARRAGINIDAAVKALMTAKEHLRKGDLGAATRMATRADTAVDVTIRAHREASRSLKTLSNSLSVAELVGADVTDCREGFEKAKALLGEGAYFKSTEFSKAALESADRRLDSQIRVHLERAGRALATAAEAGAQVSSTETKLKEARARLSKREYSKAFALSSEVLVEGTSAALTELKDRIGGIGEFAKSVAGEIESLSQVQDAIVHSRERSIEMVRKYSSMSEDVVSQAYDNASAYMRVSQDIVKQAYDSSIGLDPDNGDTGPEPTTGVPRTPAAAQILGIGSTDRKLRIIDLYLSGRIDEKQLDKLLSLVDSSPPAIEISDGVQLAKR